MDHANRGDARLGNEGGPASGLPPAGGRPEQPLIERDRATAVSGLIDTLTRYRRCVLVNAFGLGGTEPLTAAQIAHTEAISMGRASR